jgi:WD40 repeat protein
MMMMRSFVWGLVFSVVMLGVWGAEEQALPWDADEVARLVGQLGESDFTARIGAFARLSEMAQENPEGLLAMLPKEHDDPEVQDRLDEIRRRFGSSGGEVKILSGLAGPVRSVDVSLDGKWIATCSRTVGGIGFLTSYLTLWNAETGETEKVLASVGGWSQVAFSPDGTRLACSPFSHTVTLWDIPSGRATMDLEGGPYQVEGVAFSPDGKYLAACGWDTGRTGGESFRTLCLWEITTGRLLHAWDAGSHLTRCIFHPDGKRLAVVVQRPSYDCLIDGKKATAGEVRKERELASKEGRKANIEEVPRFPAGVGIWDLDKGAFVRHFYEGERRLAGIAISPGGKVLAGVSEEEVTESNRTTLVVAGTSSIGLWEVESGRLLWSIEGDFHVDPNCLQPVVFHPDGKTIAVGGALNEIGNGRMSCVGGWSYGGRRVPSVRFYDVETGKETGRRVYDRGPNYAGWISSLDYDSKGERLAVGSWELDAASERVSYWDASDDTVSQGALRYVEIGKEGSLWETPVESREHRYNLAIDPEGKRVAAASGGILRLWDLASGELKREARVRIPSPVKRIAFAPDGRTVAFATEGGLIRVADSETREVLSEFDGHLLEEVRAVAFHPDGKRLVSGDSRGRLFLWSVEGNLRRSLSGGPAWLMIHEAVFSPDGKWVAVSGKVKEGMGSLVGSLGVYDAEGICQKVFPAAKWTSLAVAPDGKHLAFYTFKDGEGAIEVRSCGTWEVAKTFGPAFEGGGTLAFSPDGKALAAGERGGWAASPKGEVRLWNLETGDLLRSFLSELRGDTPVVVFSPDGSRLVSGGAYGEPQGAQLLVKGGMLEVWDVRKGDLLWRGSRNPATVEQIRLDREGTLYVLGGTLVGCEVETGKTLEPVALPLPEETLRGPLVDLAFSPDGRILAAAPAWKDTVILWNADNLEARMFVRTGAGGIAALALDPFGEKMAVGGKGKTIEIRELASGSLVRSWQTGEWVSDLAYSEDGKYLFSSSWNGLVKVWKAASGEQIRAWTADPQGMKVLDVRGETLVTGGKDYSAKVWNWETGRLLHTFPGHAKSVSAVALSPDGTRLASTGGGGEIHLWDVKKGELLETVHMHEDYISMLRFTPDGKKLVSASADTTLRIWSID